MIDDVLAKNLYKTAEYYMYNYCKIKAEIAEMREDIEESQCYQLNETGIRARGEISNPTLNKTIALEKNLWYHETWCSVVEQVFKDIKGTKYERLARMKYIEHRGWGTICHDMNIARTTFFTWVKELVDEIIMLAIEKGIPRTEQNKRAV